jgi:pyruvate dehydrogenase E2 component (dihydrolipoamide acetyltransferase)
MPALGMAQETGKILRWLKAEGEMLRAGEPLMEIETDKAVLEIEAPVSGRLADVRAREGDDVPVGETVALILAEGEAARPPKAAALDKSVVRSSPKSAPSPARAASPLAAKIAAEKKIDLSLIRARGARIEKEDVLRYLEAAGSARPGGRVLASPKARRLAAERGLDLAAIAGSGPAGAVVAEDLSRVAAMRPTPASMSNTWRVMAERVTQSWTQVPHFYLLRELRADGLMVRLDRARRAAKVRVTITDLLVELVASALVAHPNVNATWHEGSLVRQREINIGLAMAVEEGLVVPVIHRAAELDLEQIATRRLALAASAAAGRLALKDVQGGTFTISNLGMYGIDAFNAILNSPQAAILAVGRIADRVVAEDGQPCVRPTMFVSLTCDHRVVDGARGAQFLQTLAEEIETPPSMDD